MEQQNVFSMLVGTFVMLSKDPAKEAASVEPSVLSWKKVIEDGGARPKGAVWEPDPGPTPPSALTR